MTLDIILFIAGIALVLFGADRLVEGASSVARRRGLSEFLIGVTIVGIGTSLPELAVSLFGALRGSGEIAIGNVAGSNLFNTMLILGVTALISPLAFTRENIRRDIPLCIAASIVLALFASRISGGETPFSGGTITRLEGGILLLSFALYLWSNFRSGGGAETGDGDPDAAAKGGSSHPLRPWLQIVFGLAALVAGGKLFVDHAVNIATSLGIPESVIANTIMAGGTSAPELAVCVVAALKGRNQMAIGNVLGSNVSNILLIIGSSALVTPLRVDRVNHLSLLAVAVSSIVLMLGTIPWRKSELGRWKGGFFILAYVGYILMLIL